METSNRPKSKLNCATAAINSLYDAFGIPSPARSDNVKHMVDALVRAFTTAPMKKSCVLPIHNFNDLFLSWSDNSELSIKDLRLKAITLLSLSAMLRPSDIAPRLISVGDKSGKQQNNIFSVDQVMFNCDGSMTISFFGIKNDTHRDGFEVNIPAHTNPKLDPLITLKNYIDKTAQWRAAGSNAVFLSLKSPRVAIEATTVSGILQQAIRLAGLSSEKYSAKSFRPTGATTAIANNIGPKIVQKLGRWKTESVFFEHYVHSKPPEDYTDKVIGNM